ncbi:DNA (cytosine-5-)-methyltransferase [Priestia megaterium]|uniref:Cytosine-specific methyltransferase n=1 Tax=Priestia megaterium TaxID=1404 RepID=A0A6H1PC73_PRIMG|nr:DNA (cytosine-5-)-methyltransferase [Priestia megaterium]
MMKKTVVELFAGVGGFHLGLKNAGGWDVLWANQWEPGKKVQHAYDCYRSHFPETKAVNMDISVVNDNPTENPIPKHNLLVGGFPCQDYSVASTGAKGIEGKKGVLWWEIRRILERHQAPFVLLENVDRLLKSPTKQRGRDFAVMLACFRDLGYNVEWRVINAADYGFAQRRRRVFIFAYHETTNYYKRQVNKIDPTSLNQHLVKNGFFAQEFPIGSINDALPWELKEDLKDISDNYKNGAFGEAGIMFGDVIFTGKYEPAGQPPMTLGEVLVKEEVEEKYYLGENLEQWKYMKGAKEQPRKTKEGFEYMFREGAIAFPDPLERPARTMLTSESSKNRSTHVIEDPNSNNLRLLTPIEAERLNGFEDNWTKGMPEKFRYFCMGNALVVGLVTKMGKSLNEIFGNEVDTHLTKNVIHEKSSEYLDSNTVEEQKIIRLAKEESKNIIEAAKLDKQKMIFRAKEEAEKILENAKTEEQKIISQAEKEAARILKNADLQKQNIIKLAREEEMRIIEDAKNTAKIIIDSSKDKVMS